MKLPILFAGTIALALTSLSSRGATFTVANGDVTGLIAAINAANTNGQNDTITLAENGTYTLTTLDNYDLYGGKNGLPAITGDNGHTLTINGRNSILWRSIAAGTPEFRILAVEFDARVVVLDLIVSRGRVFGYDTGNDNCGGGIRNAGDLTMRNCTISDNAAVSGRNQQSCGGGIYNLQGSLTLINCILRANIATGNGELARGGVGGGICNGGTLTVTNCTFSQNQAVRNSYGGGYGGGIDNTGGVIVRNCTFELNVAGGDGGGIYMGGGNAFLRIFNSTFNSNDAANEGGGIFHFAGVTLINSTLSRNVADVAGGGIASRGTLTIQNTIIAGNRTETATAPDADVISASAVSSLGHNLIGITDSSSGWFGSDLTGTSVGPQDAKLLTLNNNGGPTQTMALDPTSEAVNAGDNSVMNAPFNVTSDQRVFTRKAGAAVDIGAFELNAVPLLRGDANGDAFCDFVLFNSGDRKTAIWRLQRNALLSGTYGPTLPAGWSVVGVADFDQEGGQDYILFNPSTRQTAVWFLQHAILVGGDFGPTLPANWKLIAVVDFNRDANLDYVLFNPRTRQTAIWYLKSTNFINSVYGPTLPAGWILIDALEVNSNGKPDFVLFSPSTRQTAIWYLQFTAFASSAFGPTLPSGWILQGAGDFDSDAKPDFVLSESSTRKTAIWYLDGATFTTGAYGPTLPSGYTLAFP